jgi:hypothetical protein
MKLRLIALSLMIVIPVANSTSARIDTGAESNQGSVMADYQQFDPQLLLRHQPYQQEQMRLEYERNAEAQWGAPH